jgi:hypothetical protein
VKLILTRETACRPDCTLGFLEIGDLKLATMERPWIPSTTNSGGLKGKSCVPLGTYRLVRHDTVKKPKTWALVNESLDVIHYEGDDNDPDEDRATCLIHVANFARQLEGCIAPGIAHVVVDGEYMVTSSEKAMGLLRAALPWTDEHTLEIR